MEGGRLEEMEEQSMKKKRKDTDDGDSVVNMSVWPSWETGELTLVIV